MNGLRVEQRWIVYRTALEAYLGRGEPFESGSNWLISVLRWLELLKSNERGFCYKTLLAVPHSEAIAVRLWLEMVRTSKPLEFANVSDFILAESTVNQLNKSFPIMNGWENLDLEMIQRAVEFLEESRLARLILGGILYATHLGFWLIADRKSAHDALVLFYFLSADEENFKPINLFDWPESLRLALMTLPIVVDRFETVLKFNFESDFWLEIEDYDIETMMLLSRVILAFETLRPGSPNGDNDPRLDWEYKLLQRWRVAHWNSDDEVWELRPDF